MKKTDTPKVRDVYIVDGSRTPFLKARGLPGDFSAADLAVAACRDLLAYQPFSPEDLDEVVLGCVMPSPAETNIARVVALRLGCGDHMPAYTVQRNCASGMQAIDDAYKDIAMGRHDLVLAGGVEAMSRAPLLFNESMVEWFANWMGAKTFFAKLGVLCKFKLKNFVPIIALLKGLKDPLVGLSMGQTAENLAYRFGIDRGSLDQYALESQLRSARAIEEGFLSEVSTLYDTNGAYYESDTGVRPDSSLETLDKLKPFFDKKFGRVTAGNSSQVTDGAACVLLASSYAVKRYGLKVLGKIQDTHWAGCPPEEMGLGPVYASTPMLQRQGLSLEDVDFWEINEAFAAQVLACMAAWHSKDYCQHYLGLQEAFGLIDRNRLNVDGGAIAVGHPVGASGARIVLHLLQVLRRHKAKRGVASICIGGGQGGAMLIENVSEVTA